MFFRKVEQKPYYDLHCHILPGIDDGAEDVSMSVEMLAEMARQGCQGFIATSHYYDHRTIDAFLMRRQQAYLALVKGLQQAGRADWIDRIGLGAEAAYHPNLVNDPDLKKLCFMNPRTGRLSNYLLLEMPFSKWSPGVLRDVRTMTTTLGLKVIIAHLERFPDFTTEESIEELLNTNVIIQMNAGCLLHRGSKRRGLRMVKHGITQVMGTDSHNVDNRRPTMQDGSAVLQKAGLSDRVDSILNYNRYIYRDVMGKR